MKCHNLFYGKNKKNISICLQLKILPRVQMILVSGIRIACYVTVTTLRAAADRKC